ncbi:OsmC family protein [Psychroflexus planctonicus]|uniref:Peroxiredoxin, SACOL1771 subfamily n=1 Tax=Psychroflexus planctonicus TaxID=1526575 RepID=A0ABQ1SGX7_9FLAO|nr:OsmC family protein [Psychroflexus planctonicus]GGE30830.1 hypothetical protein GCM10010832_09080 [Psychroflexus planctonicus]
MENNHEYNVEVEWINTRKGKMYSPELHNFEADLPNEIEVATPTQFPDGIPHTWSPEHLFTSAVSSCLMTTFLAIAEYSKLDFESFKCKSKGILDKVEGKFAMREIQLYPEVVIKDEAHYDKTLKVLEKAKKACLISNSVKSEVNMFPQIIVLQQEAV